jgi:hypothetical protein
MTSRLHGFGAIVAAAAAVASLGAQQPAASGPTTKDPLRFRAVLQTQGQDSGLMGVAEITIERWTTDAERDGLVSLLAGATLKTRGQDKLLRALQDVKPRTGFIKLPNTLGWDLRYARDNVQADGTRQIVIATDKPVSFAAAASGAESTDYPFTLLEMRMGKDNKGEGRMLARSAISTKDGRLQLENYGNEPIKLSQITQEEDKKK